MTNDEMAAICRERTPRSLALFYNWMFKPLGFELPPHLWPVVCGLCDTRIDKLMLIVGPGAGKSQLLSITYPAWLLGGDPTQTIIGVSGAENLAQGFMTAVMDLIQHNVAWPLIYPDVKPDKEAGWSTTNAFVTGRRIGVPDANFWAGGLTSRVLVGKHGRTLILDDLHNADNSQTEEMCKQVVRRYYNTLLGRADPMGCRFVLAGRRWHTNDIYGHLKNSEEWVCLTLPAERKDSSLLWHDVHVPDFKDDGVTPYECVFTDHQVHCADGQIWDIKKGCAV